MIASKKTLKSSGERTHPSITPTVSNQSDKHFFSETSSKLLCPGLKATSHKGHTSNRKGPTTWFIDECVGIMAYEEHLRIVGLTTLERRI